MNFEFLILNENMKMRGSEGAREQWSDGARERGREKERRGEGVKN